MAASSDQPATAAWTDIVKTAAAAVTTSPGPTSLAGGYPRSNPLYSIVDGFTSIVLAFFAFIKSILSFSTVTIPHACFTVLHYSLTLQLTFPSLLVLFLAALVASLFWLRHKHRSYERLKEAPLKTDEGFNLHPELNQQGTDQKQGPFHTYLDELLQAIRIFGFLEKPVSLSILIPHRKVSHYLFLPAFRRRYSTSLHGICKRAVYWQATPSPWTRTRPFTSSSMVAYKSLLRSASRTPASKALYLMMMKVLGCNSSTRSKVVEL